MTNTTVVVKNNTSETIGVDYITNESYGIAATHIDLVAGRETNIIVASTTNIRTSSSTIMLSGDLTLVRGGIVRVSGDGTITFFVIQ